MFTVTDHAAMSLVSRDKYHAFSSQTSSFYNSFCTLLQSQEFVSRQTHELVKYLKKCCFLLHYQITMVQYFMKLVLPRDVFHKALRGWLFCCSRSGSVLFWSIPSWLSRLDWMENQTVGKCCLQQKYHQCPFVFIEGASRNEWWTVYDSVLMSVVLLWTEFMYGVCCHHVSCISGGGGCWGPPCGRPENPEDGMDLRVRRNNLKVRMPIYLDRKGKTEQFHYLNFQKYISYHIILVSEVNNNKYIHLGGKSPWCIGPKWESGLELGGIPAISACIWNWESPGIGPSGPPDVNQDLSENLSSKEIRTATQIKLKRKGEQKIQQHGNNKQRSWNILL